MKPEIQVIVGLVVGLFATFLISGLLDSGPSYFRELFFDVLPHNCGILVEQDGKDALKCAINCGIADESICINCVTTDSTRKFLALCFCDEVGPIETRVS